MICIDLPALRLTHRDFNLVDIFSAAENVVVYPQNNEHVFSFH